MSCHSPKFFSPIKLLLSSGWQGLLFLERFTQDVMHGEKKGKKTFQGLIKDNHVTAKR